MANPAPDDTELEQLLTQLLRQISPAFIADNTGSRPDSVGRQGVASRKQAVDVLVSDLEAGDVASDDEAGCVGAPAGSRPGADGGTAGSGTAGSGTAGSGTAGAGTASGGAAGGITTGVGATPAMSASEARALIELVSAHGIAQGELAAVLRLDKSTVSRLAAGLERKGWVRRGRDEDNQRYVRLYLTPQGAEIARRVWQAWQSRQARILASLSGEERAGLIAGLGGLVRGLAAEGLLRQATASGEADQPQPGESKL